MINNSILNRNRAAKSPEAGVTQLLKDCNLALEKNNVAILEVQNKIDALGSQVSMITERVNDLVSKEEFAQICNVTPGTIHARYKEGMYETPAGYTERGYYNQGNQGNQIFRIPLAMEYYEINKEAKEKSSK